MIGLANLPVEEREARQKMTYQGIVKTCLKIAACNGITFWGFLDKHNSLSQMRFRTPFVLVF
jgi:hypothetical protein